jgi:histone-lysine N-methyltransferase EZH2
METALRLESQYTLSFADLDATGLLPLKLLPGPGNNGLAHKIRHRYVYFRPQMLSERTKNICSDLPDCPVISLLTKFYSHRPVLPGLSDFQSRLESVVSIFCPNLNCLQPYCSVHGETETSFSFQIHLCYKPDMRTVDALPMAQPAVPQALNKTMISRQKTSCGNECFVLPSSLPAVSRLSFSCMWQSLIVET